LLRAIGLWLLLLLLLLLLCTDCSEVA